MTLIVLGAGATRGASFVSDVKSAPLCLPPLDGDFFTQLQRIANPKHTETIDGVLRDAVEFFGQNFRVTLETMFTTVEHSLRIANATKATAMFSPERLEKKRVRLKQAIAAVLEESLTADSLGGKGQGRVLRDCEYHGLLVDRLTVRDSILSFNYDCLMDHMLVQCGKGKWNARYGYGLTPARGQNGVIPGEDAWTPEMPGTVQRDNTLKLLKLHGSIHFRGSSLNQFTLKERPYTRQNGNLRFEIIPPEWNKHFDEGIFRKLWIQAWQAIHRTESIVVIGYSFPPTDMHTSALFRASVRPGKLKRVAIVNPDPEARRRTREVLHGGMAPDTRVLVFDRFCDFAKVEREMWGD